MTAKELKDTLRTAIIMDQGIDQTVKDVIDAILTCRLDPRFNYEHKYKHLINILEETRDA